MPPKPSEAVSGNPLFGELCEYVAKETHNSTFACGGSIPIVSGLPENEAKFGDTPDVQEPDSEPTDSPFLSPWRKPHPEDPAAADLNEPPTRSTMSLPVDLRWDSKNDTTLSRETKVSFPLTHETENNLAKLVEDCEPATFGKGDRDVYDESYRKATKMEPSRFSSTFNPYDVGIVDTIAQMLLPTLRHSQQTRAVKAELYKLNFYSAPSGKFKAHVDTPRSADQFGSLVVCLPLTHKGGALEVRHNGKTVAFDWGEPNSGPEKPAIKWAAFYSDCEHEVLEVTEGHRLTLTYNLYVVRGNGFLGGNSPALDPATLPLYKTINALVQDETLWKHGGYIGYHCSHIYPHTSTSKLHFMVPDNLKGVDMAMYSAFSSLGLKVSFRPAIQEDDLGHYPFDSDVEEEGEVKRKPGDYDTEPVLLGADGKLKWEEWYGGEDGTSEECDHWTGKRKYSKNQTGYGYNMERIPTYLRYKHVHWVNEFGHKEIQVTYLAYGNNHSTAYVYSCLVMVIEIPPRAT